MLSAIITVVGLLVLEIVQSVDNAIVNAHMLKTMGERARKWFLVWGIFFAVFLARGILPLLIVWLTAPGITLWSAAASSCCCCTSTGCSWRRRTRTSSWTVW